MEIQGKIPQPASDQVEGKKDDMKSKRAEADRKKLERACADFESLFVYQMLKTMRQTVPKGGFLGKVTGKDTYEMMLDQKLADGIASKPGGIGVQKMLLEKMDRIKK